MIVSKYGKSYDTSNGSEQPSEKTPRSQQASAPSATQRWEDDGGPIGDPPPMLTAVPPRKPVWSVLSLRRLAIAILRQRKGDDRARAQQETGRVDREHKFADRIGDEQKARAASLDRDRYRNAWENT